MRHQAQAVGDRSVRVVLRRIAAIGQSLGLNFGYLFLAGYRRGLRKHGIVPDTHLMAAGNINEAGGYEVTPRVMRGEDPPTAIIFNNDAMALGGCKALTEMGIMPGRDVAVIVPELVATRWYHYLLHNQTAAVIKAYLLFSGFRRVVVINVPWYLSE